MTTLHLPAIGKAPEPPVGPAQLPCGMVEMAAQLAHLLASDPRQQHAVWACSEHLTRAAQSKADDMRTRDYFDHTTPDGVAPNAWVRSFGVTLPYWYRDDANNVESISANQQSAAEVVAGFWESEGHRAHVFGIDPFWRAHETYGVGYSSQRDGSSRHSTYWVVMTA